MTCGLYLVFEGGRRYLESEIDGLEEAALFALNLADEIGLRPAADGHGLPRRVEIVRAGRLELSIQILRGGLLPRKGVPKSGSR